MALDYFPTSVPPPVVLRELKMLRSLRREFEEVHGSVVDVAAVVVAAEPVAAVVVAAEEVAAVVLGVHGCDARLQSAVPIMSALPSPSAPTRILIPNGIRWGKYTAKARQKFEDGIGKFLSVERWFLWLMLAIMLDKSHFLWHSRHMASRT